MLIDLSCPLEIRGYELLRDDRNNTRAYIRLYNLSDRVICGYAATANWFNGCTQESETENILVDEMHVPPHSGFKLVHSVKSALRIDHIEFYFSQVIFEDGEVWMPQNGDIIDIGEQPVLEGPELDALQAVAGADAIQFPQIQNKYWRCVCGRINLLETEACLRCRRDRNDVLKNLTANAVMSRRAPRGRRAGQPLYSIVVKKKKKRTDIFLLAVLIVLILVFLTLIIWGFLRGGSLPV